MNRIDFVYLFDVTDGNPNGDPDAANLPRMDIDTGHGLVTDGCLKRKIRNYVELAKGDEDGFRIYVRERAVLNRLHAEAYESAGLKPIRAKLPGREEDILRLKQFMTRTFYDVRTFGAAMNTEINCGQIRGPVQLTFGRSIDPIVPAEHTIIRHAVTNEKDAGKERTMGRKFTIPYALYRAHGFISAPFAEQSGFDDADLELLWKALENMFDNDRSAQRGEMRAQGLYVFAHQHRLGNCQAHRLFDRIAVRLKDADASIPRHFDNYVVAFDDEPVEETVPIGVSVDLGNGVMLQRLF